MERGFCKGSRGSSCLGPVGKDLNGKRGLLEEVAALGVGVPFCVPDCRGDGA